MKNLQPDRRVELPLNKEPMIRGLAYFSTLDGICSNDFIVNNKLAEFEVEQPIDEWILSHNSCLIEKNCNTITVNADLELKKAVFSMQRYLTSHQKVTLAFHFLLCSNYRNNVLFEIEDSYGNKTDFTYWCLKKRNDWLKKNVRINQYPVLFSLERESNEVKLRFSLDGMEWETLFAGQIASELLFRVTVSFYENQWLNWFYSNFIQLESAPHGGNIRILYQYDMVKRWLHSYSNLFLTFSNEDTLKIKEYCPDYIQFFISHLNFDYYIDVDLDEYYLENTMSYHKRNFEHPNLIYGYDLDNRCFLSAGIDLDGYLHYREISFESLTNAIENCKYSHRLALIQYDPVYIDYDLNIDLICELILEYLNKKDSLYRFDLWVPRQTTKHYGLDIYDSFINRLDVFTKDIRIIYFIAEHFLVMLNRLQFLHKRGKISNDRFDSLHQEIVRLYDISRNIIRKLLYVLEGRNKDFSSFFIEKLTLLKTGEEQFLHHLLYALQSPK